MAKDETERNDATPDDADLEERTAKPAGVKTAPAKTSTKTPAPAPVDEDEDDDEDDEEDEEDEDDDEADDGDDADAPGEESAPEEDTDRAPPAPEAASVAPAPTGRSTKARSTEKAALAAPSQTPAATAVRKRAPLPPDPPPAAVGKTVGVFVVVIGALSAGFWFLGTETGGDRTAPRWKTGQTVDVNITLVAGDRNDLACASATVVADRRCEFEAKNKPVAPKPEDDKLLKPYTTTDGVQFLAAGLWSQPELEATKLPAERFAVKCKYTVEGEVKKPAVRWAVRGGFSDKDNAWYAGTVKDCALSQ